MTANQLWPVCVEAYHAISKHYVPLMNAKAAEHHLPEGRAWLLLPALTFDPEFISAEKLRLRSPYIAEHKYQADLEALVAGGFLMSAINDVLAYSLSQTGREAILAVLQTGYDCMQALQPKKSKDLEVMADFLKRLVNACLQTPEPPGKWSITHSRKIDPGDDMSVMVRVDQYLSDLAAYRDDSHLAAWQVHPVDGHAWELLTTLWREEVNEIDVLVERLVHRGFLFVETQSALGHLVDLGWVQVVGDIYSLTPKGEAVRQVAEDETDRYFYRPWFCLSKQEQAELQEHLVQLKKAL